MTTPANHSPAKPTLRKDRGMSPVWIIPALTLILAGWFVTKAIQEAGQQVQIYFEDAQGLIAGRTAIRYQGLEIGMVRDINLADDLSQIYVDADIYPEATKLLGEDTQFWLVKPSASISGVTGLDALVSGNYISILPSSEPEKRKEYVYTALSERPSDALLKQGLPIELVSRDLGSINIGSKYCTKKSLLVKSTIMSSIGSPKTFISMQSFTHAIKTSSIKIVDSGMSVVFEHLLA